MSFKLSFGNCYFRIFNTVSTSILERRQEVGNLRANGESSLEVLKLFSNEGFLVGVFGAIFGIFSLFTRLI